MELSPYLLTIGIGWVVAQGAKYLVAVAKSRDFRQLNHLYISGHMPSAHTATTVALAVFVGLKDGIDSAVFGVATMLALIVMYDAVMVRRTVGEQGETLEKLIELAENEPIVKPRSAKGHTLPEVIVGAVVGLIIGSVVFFATT